MVAGHGSLQGARVGAIAGMQLDDPLACWPAVLQVKLCAARNILLNWLDYGHGYGQVWHAAQGGRVLWGAQLQLQRKAIFSLPEHFLSPCRALPYRAVPCRTAPLQRQLKCVNMADLGAELSVGTGSQVINLTERPKIELSFEKDLGKRERKREREKESAR